MQISTSKVENISLTKPFIHVVIHIHWQSLVQISFINQTDQIMQPAVFLRTKPHIGVLPKGEVSFAQPHIGAFDLRDSSKMYYLAVTLASASDGKCQKIM